MLGARSRFTHFPSSMWQVGKSINNSKRKSKSHSSTASNGCSTFHTKPEEAARLTQCSHRSRRAAACDLRLLVRVTTCPFDIFVIPSQSYGGAICNRQPLYSKQQRMQSGSTDLPWETAANSRLRSGSRSLMFIMEFSSVHSLTVVASVPSTSRTEAEKGESFRAIMQAVNFNSVEHEQPRID